MIIMCFWPQKENYYYSSSLTCAHIFLNDEDKKYFKILFLKFKLKSKSDDENDGNESAKF